MKIVRIDLEDSQPVKIMAELTIQEAGQIAKLTGDLTTDQTDETSEIYLCLTGQLFNRFWSDGVAGYLRGETE